MMLKGKCASGAGLRLVLKHPNLKSSNYPLEGSGMTEEMVAYMINTLADAANR